MQLLTNQGLTMRLMKCLFLILMPASVVINQQMDIIQFRGTTDVFLTHPKGPSHFQYFLKNGTSGNCLRIT